MLTFAAMQVHLPAIDFDRGFPIGRHRPDRGKLDAMSATRSDPAVHPLVAAGRLLVVPGVYDVLSAKLAARAGFQAVVLTGYGLSAAHLGEPDIGLLTQTEVLDTARRICAAVDVGVVVDGDTGPCREPQAAGRVLLDVGHLGAGQTVALGEGLHRIPLPRRRQSGDRPRAERR